MAVEREGYLVQIQALLPQGRAWPRAEDARLTRLLDAIAAALAIVDAAGEDLLTDILPGTTTNLLPDWERVLGLPDPCAPAMGRSVTIRRRSVVAKLAAAPAPTPTAMVDIARILGYDAEVIEHRQAVADRIPGLDTTAGRWRHVWWLRVRTTGRTRYFDALSDVGQPLATSVSDAELECRVRAAAPAHTYPVFVYAPALGGAL